VERGSSVRMGSRGHQARAACTAPTPALLPIPEGLGQRHAHGRNVVYTILVFFFLFFYFCGDPKMGYNRSVVDNLVPTKIQETLPNFFF
jgi:hypothetical protein